MRRSLHPAWLRWVIFAVGVGLLVGAFGLPDGMAHAARDETGSQDGATVVADAHEPWAGALDGILARGEFRVWVDASIPVADALHGLETKIRVVWVWTDAGWALYSPLLPGANVLLQPGSILFVVGA